MSFNRLNGRAGQKNGRPANIDEFFEFAKRRAPAYHDYAYVEEVDRRPLRPGEMMRLMSIIRGDGFRADEFESVEARCAAAFVAARIGLEEAVPVLREALLRGVDEPLARSAMEYALGCLSGMVARGTVPEKELQLKRLLQMRDSALPAERRLAEIVIEKAAIQYGTIASW